VPQMHQALVPQPRQVAIEATGPRLEPVSEETSLHIASTLAGLLPVDLLGNCRYAGLSVKVEQTVPNSAARVSAEGYTIRVTEQGIIIGGSTLEARRHGLHTLAQLLQNHTSAGRLPGYVIADWPSLSQRGFHVCYHLITEYMPQMAPNLETLLDRIRLMRHYKANLLLLEIESLFPYRRHPAIPCQLAFSRDELARIAEVCRQQGIQIVPLVQCLGHAYNVLRHPEYAHLREVPGTTQQYCATNPEVIDFYMDLFREILEAFPDVTMFHVGGDESRRLGICPRCAKKVAERGVGALYGDHVGEICRRILERNVRPLVWADIVEHAPDAVDYLPRDATLVYWNYNLLNWSRKPAFDLLKATGHETITASGARFGTHNHTMFLYSTAMSGIGSLTRETARRGLDGTIVTDWMKATPHEFSLPSLVYGMSEAWNAAGSLAVFERDFAALHYGLPEDLQDVTARVYRLLEQPVPFIEDAQTHQLDRLDRYDLSGLSIRERIGRYLSQDKIDETRASLMGAHDRGKNALALADQLYESATLHVRELDLLRLSARTQVHKANMGLAFARAVRLLRYPMPDDAPCRDQVADELDLLVAEWKTLRDETRALLLPGTFPQTVDQVLDVKFEPDALDQMVRFRDLLRAGQTLTGLFS